MMLKSQQVRSLSPEMDPLRMGKGWTVDDLSKPQIMVESTYGNSHPGSGHLNIFVEEAVRGCERPRRQGCPVFCHRHVRRHGSGP